MTRSVEPRSHWFAAMRDFDCLSIRDDALHILPRPASVLAHGDRAELIKRAETIGDVYGRDVIPERLSGMPTDAP
ncbi:MAG: hypothetical protein U9N78_11730 [Actinomycetota bacterium]|nr:hypothetical protein [Actinomycetota bacterium]